MATKYNCVKNGIKYFRKTKVIGHDPKTGKPIQKEFYGNGEKDADRQIEEYMDKLKKGLRVNAAKLTVAEEMYHWLFDVLLHSKDSKSASFEKHETNYRLYIKDSPIACVAIQNAIPSPFQDYYISLYRDGVDLVNEETNEIKHKEVSEDKIFDINKTLRLFFTYCIKQKLTDDNPCSLKNIELPRRCGWRRG